MTKAELVDAVADAAGVSKADAERTIGAYWDTVVQSVKNDDKVAWPGIVILILLGAVVVLTRRSTKA